MLEFILAPQHSYYAIAFVLVLFLFLIEVAGQFAGFSLSQLLDNSAEVDVSSDTLEGSAGLFAWLGFNKVPAVIWLVSVLTLFATLGYVFSFILLSVGGVTMGQNLAAVVVLVVTIYLNAKVCNLIALFLPKEQTSAVSKDSFSGLLAVITVGTAKQGQPAEAVVKDEFNQKHYVLVEPMDEDSFSQGENVVLVVKENSRWLATRFE